MNKLIKKIAPYALSIGLTLGSFLSSKSQNVSGYIRDVLSEQPVDSALVEIQNLGQDYTDENGFYQVEGSGVDPYLIIPKNNMPDKLEIVNILGQKVLSKNVSLEDVIGDNLLKINNLNNISSGIYPFRILDKNNQIYASGLVPIIEGNNISLVPFSIVEPKRSNNGGRGINSLDNYLSFSVDKDEYLLRETWISSPSGNVVHNEGIVPDDSLFVAFYNDVNQRGVGWGTRRWVTDPVFKIWPYEINTGNQMPQSGVDIMIDIITNYLPVFTQGFVTGQYEVVDSIPTNPENIVFVYWDNSIPFNASVGYVWNSNFEVYYGGISFKFPNISFGVALQEFTQVTGPIQNSNIITPSVFGSSLMNYTETDLNVGKWLYNRPTWNVPEDKDLYQPN